MHVVYVMYFVSCSNLNLKQCEGTVSTAKSIMRERLIAVGCPIDPPDPRLENRNRGLGIRPRSYHENCIFDLSSIGGTGYMLDVAISNPRSRPFTVCDLVVELPWDDPQFYWLEDPSELVPAREEYAFSRQLTFPRTMVLNHRILEHGRIPGYGVIAGLLLGRSFCSIPASLHHGSKVRAVMHLIDQGDTDHTMNFSLYVDRSALLQRGEGSKRKFGGLFAPGEYEGNGQHPREAGKLCQSDGFKASWIMSHDARAYGKADA